LTNGYFVFFVIAKTTTQIIGGDFPNTQRQKESTGK